MTPEEPSAPWRSAMAEWRQHWRIGLAATVAAGVSWSLWVPLSSLFISPLQASFGWSRGEIALAFNAVLLGAVSAPFLGRLVDKLGARRVLLGGFLATALGYLALSMLNGSLMLYYGLFAYLAVVGLTTTGLTYTRVISATFVRSRGLALAISRSGLAVAALVLPPITFALITAYGWRAGFLLLAGLIIVLALPLSYAFIPRAQSTTRAVTAAPEPWTALLRNRKVLMLCVAGALTMAPINAMLTQMHPLLSDKTIESSQAAMLLGYVGLASITGALITGMLVDRFWAPAIAALFALLPAAGCILLMGVALTPERATAAILLIGFGQGAEIDALAFIIARYFGMRSYASLYGLCVLAMSSVTAVMISTVGALYDVQGNYEYGLSLCAIALVGSAGLFLALGRYPRGEADGAIVRMKKDQSLG